VSKNQKIGIGVLAILIIGIFGLVVFSGDDSADEQVMGETSGSVLSADEAEEINNVLDLDLSSLGGSYRVEVETVDATGRVTDGYIEIDENGNTRTVITDNNQSSTIVIVDGKTYLQNPNDEAWYTFPVGTEDIANLAVPSLAPSQQDLSALNDDASLELKGVEKCSSGQCRVYENNDETTQDRGIIKVDNDTNRLTSIEYIDSDGSTSSITYIYDIDITIAAPENAQEFDFPIEN
jgi:outer membrane lipoprotein-sorting protein